MLVLVLGKKAKDMAPQGETPKGVQLEKKITTLLFSLKKSAPRAKHGIAIY